MLHAVLSPWRKFFYFLNYCNVILLHVGHCIQTSKLLSSNLKIRSSLLMTCKKPVSRYKHSVNPTTNPSHLMGNPSVTTPVPPIGWYSSMYFLSLSFFCLYMSAEWSPHLWHSHFIRFSNREQTSFGYRNHEACNGHETTTFRLQYLLRTARTFGIRAPALSDTYLRNWNVHDLFFPPIHPKKYPWSHPPLTKIVSPLMHAATCLHVQSLLGSRARLENWARALYCRTL